MRNGNEVVMVVVTVHIPLTRAGESTAACTIIVRERKQHLSVITLILPFTSAFENIDRNRASFSTRFHLKCFCVALITNPGGQMVTIPKS